MTGVKTPLALAETADLFLEAVPPDPGPDLYNPQIATMTADAPLPPDKS